MTATPGGGSIAFMEWGLVWLMVVLKVPLAMLLWLVWWAVRQTGDEAGQHGDGSGGSGVVDARRRPLPRPPRPPRRGPHGDRAPATPARVRTGPVRTRAPER